MLSGEIRWLNYGKRPHTSILIKDAARGAVRRTFIRLLNHFYHAIIPAMEMESYFLKTKYHFRYFAGRRYLQYLLILCFWIYVRHWWPRHLEFQRGNCKTCFSQEHWINQTPCDYLWHIFIQGCQPRKLKKNINHLQSNAADGYDSIRATFLKLAGHHFTNNRWLLFNACVISSCFLLKWNSLIQSHCSKRFVLCVKRIIDQWIC